MRPRGGKERRYGKLLKGFYLIRSVYRARDFLRITLEYRPVSL